MKTTTRSIRVGVLFYAACLTTSVVAADMGSWAYKLKIEFPGYGRSATLTNFPALVVMNTGISGFSYDKFADAAGADLRFTDSQGTELNYEIEKWDTNGSSYVWVQVPVLADTNTAIWAYMGNENATVPDYSTNGATWASGFVGVWHLGDASAPSLDSSPNHLQGTQVGSPTYQAAGQIDKAVDLGSGNNGVKMADTGLLDMGSSNFTVSIWVRKQEASSAFSNVGLFNKWLTGAYPDQCEWLLETTAGGSDNRPVFTVAIGTTKYTCADASSLTLNTWYHLAGKREGTNLSLYVNGVLHKTTTGVVGAVNNAGRDMYLGYFAYSPTLSLDGRLDEARLSSVARSSNWLWACWFNTASNSAFVNFGEVEFTEMVLIPGADENGVTNDFFVKKNELSVNEYVVMLNALTNGEISVASGEVRLTGAGDLLCLTDQADSDAYIAYDSEAAMGERFEAAGTKGAHPMVFVTWFGAALYCNWKSDVEGYDPVYEPTNGWSATLANNGYRLPTEAEWYKAAAWNAGQAIFTLYGTGGNTLSTNDANYLNSGDSCETNAVRTCPVGSYAAVGYYNLVDACGNAWEWCHGFLDAGGSDPDVDAHAVRGGSWGNLGQDVRAASRSGNKPGQALNTVGFRIVRQAE